LGADIPFCMVGGRARVQGIGEIVSPLPFVTDDITLIVPPLAVSTPDVYRMWDCLGGPTGQGTNDLEPAALVVEPRLATWRDRIAAITGVIPTLAGSGATWWIFGAHTDLAEALPETTVLVTKTRPLAG
ncbi:MAG: 4-(cytidine 5'-diphospho)-2-C-methyl-D-erythritol kinase, partial [Ilumatobacteraceae bacterium]